MVWLFNDDPERRDPGTSPEHVDFMCGLAGIISNPAIGSWKARPSVEAMTEVLEHRGPDDSGFWSDPRHEVHLGFRRLAILDLSKAGHQPMTSKSGRYVTVFNGEVYNFQELRAVLSRDGHRFRGHSDTEVILAAFERWGPRSATARFDGMFAIAVWDTEFRRLSLIRDRLGIKPLFLLETSAGIAFASEARAFHQCPLYEGRGDMSVAWQFLQRLYVPDDRSILAGVTKVPPGEILEFSIEQGAVTRRQSIKYWNLGEIATTSQAQPADDDRYVVHKTKKLLRESVRQRLVADVPVGAFLSGGIDSTIVVALMQEEATRAVKTYSVSFDDPQFDEGPYAQAVARHLGTDHTSVAFTSDEVLGHIPSLPSLSDEPMANPSLLPTLLVSRIARREVTVALSGDGGDELFGGYNRYLHGASLIRKSRMMPLPLRKGLAEALRFSANTVLPRIALALLRPKTVGSQHSSGERMRKLAKVLSSSTESTAYARLLNVGESALHHDPSGAAASRDALCQELCDLESRFMLADQLDYLPGDLLAKVDRASMWQSLEVRVPFLDHRVVEFSWAIPASMKFRQGLAKWPLRKIAYEYVPVDLVERPKMGFTVPIARWLQGELREWARDITSPSRSRDDGIWDRRKLNMMWKQFEGGREDLGLSLWATSVLQGWLDAWNVRLV